MPHSTSGHHKFALGGRVPQRIGDFFRSAVKCVEHVPSPLLIKAPSESANLTDAVPGSLDIGWPRNFTEGARDQVVERLLGYAYLFE